MDGNIRTNEGLINVYEINVFVGRKGHSEIFHRSCTTKEFDLGGGQSKESKDVIILPEGCSYGRLTLDLPPHTTVKNRANIGTFYYLVNLESDSEVFYRTEIINGPQHHFQFNYGFQNIKSVEFNQSVESIQITMQSRSSYSFPMSDPKFINGDNEYTNPKLIFVQYDKHDNPIVMEIKVKTKGAVHAVINVTQDFGNDIRGIENISNEFLFGAPHSSFKRLIGGNRSNRFLLHSVKSIELLEGSSDKGQQNILKLFDDFHSEQKLLVNLLDGGNVTYLTSPNEYVIKKLKDIQIFEGRPKYFERVLLQCNTLKIDHADEIVVTNHNCPDYKVTILVRKSTKISFEGNGMENEVLPFENGGSFFYVFEELTSFHIFVSNWDMIQTTKQIFYLKFEIDQLDNIKFDFDGFKLTYTIANENYSHFMSSSIGDDEMFYSQPEFMSADDFHIQVSRTGEIYLTYAKGEKIDPNEITPEFISQYGDVANKLQANIIIKTNTDFIYVGYNSSDSENRNILTNINSRSHLVGGGGNNTIYAILDPDFDVFIYSGFKNNQPLPNNIKQIIDLTEIVSQIRILSESKYVPSIFEDGNDLIISMEGFEEFQGKIRIIDGVQYAFHFQIKLNVGPMEIATEKNDIDVFDGKRRKRSSSSGWKIVPTPIVIERGSVVLLSSKDLEDNQQIISPPPVKNDDNDTETHSEEYKLSKLGKNVIFTNLGSTQVENVVTFALLDFYGQNDDVNETEMETVHNVSIHLGALVIEDVVEIEDIEPEPWEEVVEHAEVQALKNVPEIERKFTLYVYQTPSEDYQNLAYMIAGFFTVIFVISLLIGTCNLFVKVPKTTYNLVPQKDKLEIPATVEEVELKCFAKKEVKISENEIITTAKVTEEESGKPLICRVRHLEEIRTVVLKENVLFNGH